MHTNNKYDYYGSSCSIYYPFNRFSKTCAGQIRHQVRCCYYYSHKDYCCLYWDCCCYCCCRHYCYPSFRIGPIDQTECWTPRRPHWSCLHNYFPGQCQSYCCYYFGCGWKERRRLPALHQWALKPRLCQTRCSIHSAHYWHSRSCWYCWYCCCSHQCSCVRHLPCYLNRRQCSSLPEHSRCWWVDSAPAWCICSLPNRPLATVSRDCCQLDYDDCYYYYG